MPLLRRDEGKLLWFYTLLWLAIISDTELLAPSSMSPNQSTPRASAVSAIFAPAVAPVLSGTSSEAAYMIFGQSRAVDAGKQHVVDDTVRFANADCANAAANRN